MSRLKWRTAEAEKQFNDNDVTQRPTRAEVEPSKKWWGDREAEAAGLYEPNDPTIKYRRK